MVPVVDRIPAGPRISPNKLAILVYSATRRKTMGAGQKKISLSEEGIEKHTDMVVSFLFSTLGWKLSTEKLVDFSSVCEVLGVSLDLRDARQTLPTELQS